ncbi:MAG: HNH endonuclease [Deltaproteobacteria bacterium]|nr:HNH endonuclease [Deltaproteobacteria bacterium]
MRNLNIDQITKRIVSEVENNGMEVDYRDSSFTGENKSRNFWIDGTKRFGLTYKVDRSLMGNGYIDKFQFEDPKKAVVEKGREKSWGKRVVLSKLGDTIDEQFNYLLSLLQQIPIDYNSANRRNTKTSTELAASLISEEISEPEKYYEGATNTISVNTYERNALARKKCLDYYGYECCVCGFDFETKYGDIGKEYIHVHHLRPIASIGEKYELDPIKDLRPICPNCHSMIHRYKDGISINELKISLQN